MGASATALAYVDTTIPPRAAAWLARETVTFPEALEFLGIGRTLGYAMGRRYMLRVAKLLRGVVVDTTKLRPQRHHKLGYWIEIPCYQCGGKRFVRTDLLVPMSYPEVPWPG